MNLPRRCLWILSAALLTCISCSQQRTAERAKEAAERVRASLSDVDAPALAQKVDEKVVRRVQEELKAIDEYQGEVTGKLDPVTLNAIQAFQRSQGLDDSGFLNPKTLKRLAAAK